MNREALVKHMVDRFLSYSLPEDFSPDGGITFERFANRSTEHQVVNSPQGTNLLDHRQAKAMVEYMLEGYGD